MPQSFFPSSSRFCNKRSGVAAIFAILILTCIFVTSYLSTVALDENNGLRVGDDSSSFKAPYYHPNTIRQNNNINNNNNTTTMSITRPKLSSILDWNSKSESKTIIGDPQSLLDFAIIGFPKCGTTALHHWLGYHPQIHLLDNEVFALLNNAPDRLIFRLYTQLPSNETYKRGYKNPLDIRVPHSLDYLQKYFPKTVLMIGIRNPIKWFESLYNFKVQNLPRHVNPNYWGDPNDLIGTCIDWNDTNCVGTSKGLFHVHLAALGKVLPISTSLIQQYPQFLSNVSYMPNPVFLYESEQLTHLDQEHSKQFRYDLLRLLGLLPMAEQDDDDDDDKKKKVEEFINLLPDMIPRSKPDFNHFSQREQSRRNKHKVDLCQERYLPVRTELLKMAQEASIWIRTSGFLSNPSVTISSPDYFNDLLLSWMTDPCAGSTKQ